MKKIQTILPLFFVASAGLLLADGEVRVSDAEAKTHIASRVEPEYPAVARQMRVSGRVTIDVYVETDGTVSRVEPLSGNPLLTSSGVKAIKRWKFSPFVKEGKPVKVIAPLALEFRL